MSQRSKTKSMGWRCVDCGRPLAGKGYPVCSRCRAIRCEKNEFSSQYLASPPPPARAIWDLVIEDIRRRNYPTRPRANNEKDAILDAYHHALDLVMGLRQFIEARTGQKISLEEVPMPRLRDLVPYETVIARRKRGKW